MRRFDVEQIAPVLQRDVELFIRMSSLKQLSPCSLQMSHAMHAMNIFLDIFDDRNSFQN